MRRRSLLAASLARPALAAAATVTTVTSVATLPGCSSWREQPLPAIPVADDPPAAPREFRAAWVATVANIDWPSRKGLSADRQLAEMHAILDSAVALRLNAIVLQVRPSADALYRSSLEPWSEYLTGTQGLDPGYDPLERWLAAAHARGLELHAWLNPYRARQSGASSEPAPAHVSRRQPDWVRRYGDQLWMDPGEPGAAEHTLAVCRDLLSRYAVDGLHIDDYFYPYPVNDPATKQELDFPDEAGWHGHQAAGGLLSRADWRRDNVDRLVQRLHALVRELRPTARLGISPFGLPKPEARPAGIAGFSQYDKLYAHVERWLAEGWMDYLAPQLYWPRGQRAQAFEPLLRSWQSLNPLGRHVWPGLFTSKATQSDGGWADDEIPAQVELMRAAPATGGHLHFSMVALLQNRRGLADRLRGGVYATAALPPATPWLSATACGPVLLTRESGGTLRLSTREGAAPARFALWTRAAHQAGADWQFAVVPPDGRLQVAYDAGHVLVASAVNGLGEEGPRSGFVA